MQPIRELRARTFVLGDANIDTDQIIPARFLTTTERAGLGKHAFADWRWLADGAANPQFPLNQAEFRGARILVAGRNFGCGSSREHASWALLDAGVQAVISSEIADIFRGNALKNGLLPIVLPEAVVHDLLQKPGIELCIDVEACTVELPDGSKHTFALERFARTCLLEGVDQLGWLLGRQQAIQAYEEKVHAC